MRSGGDSQRQGRPARPAGRADRPRRRQRPEHGRRRLQRADPARQRRPAAGHVLVAAQPSGLGGRGAQPDALHRARRRGARDLRARLPVRAVLHPAGDRRPSGRSVRRVVLALPENERPKTVAYAVLDDPFTVPVFDAMRATFEENGIETVYDETYPAGTRTSTASPTRSSRPTRTWSSTAPSSRTESASAAR